MRILILVTTILISMQAFAKGKSDWEVVEIKNEFESLPIYPKPYPVSSTIFFKNKKKLSTNIINIKVIDIIISDKGVPFVIFSGNDCYDCHFNRSIYIHSPKDGFLDGRSGKNSYSYPGKLYSYLDESLLSDDRLFYGNCLSHKKKNVVWYSKYLGKDKKWHKSVYAVEFLGSKGKKFRTKINYSMINTALSFVKQGKCTEVTGREMTSEP